MTQAKRELSDVKVERVSLVGKPANAQTFLIMKQEKLNIEIESDGTGRGSVVTINGDEMPDLRSFNFSFYNIDKDALVDCSYSKVVESDDGFKRTETFYLSKSKGENKMVSKEILELLKEYSGKDDYEFVQADLSEDAVTILKESLKLVNGYKAEFPDEMRDAVGVLMQYAASATVEKEVEKVEDNKDDKESVAKEENTDDNKDDNKDAVTKATEDLTKSVEALTKKIEDSSTEVEKALKEITERLDVVEKSTGVKKSIDGQDDEVNSDDEFPSLKIS